MTRKNNDEIHIDSYKEGKYSHYKLSKDLVKNINIFKDLLMENETVVYRFFSNQYMDSLSCCIIYIDTMIDKKIINEDILKPIMNTTIRKITPDILISKVLYLSSIQQHTQISELMSYILTGKTLLFIDGYEEVLCIDTIGWQQRPISEPQTENVIRGPREGFTESLSVNISLLQRKIPNEDLKLQFKEIGVRTKTKICICYIEDIIDKRILEELYHRLDKIDIDGILESNYIEELISDARYSPFSTIGYSERPDIIAGKLLEGRLAIICDGTPVVLTLPFIFVEYFQVNEDYYKNYIASTINRLLRIMGLFLTTSVPAIYVALATFHQEMIPTPLLLSISAAREGIPFPTVIEALLMLLVFEVMREAGTRLPTAIGQSVSIVGALVLGEAAVTARFISAPMVIITALTGISSFLNPHMIETIIVIRFIFLIVSSFFGLYGYIFVLIGIIIHLMNIRSFSIPYMLNITSLRPQEMKDIYVRAPWWSMFFRNKLISNNKLRKTRGA